MRNPEFVTNQIYHVFNRGVEKRNIFLNNQDHFRFIHDLFEFNDEAPAAPISVVAKKQSIQFFEKSLEVSLPRIALRREPRKLLVEILVFCLMPNHYHLLLKQRVNGGVTKFMRKLNTGYTNYFNIQYERVGPLLQGKFKAILIQDQAHFIHLPYYIHLNPLDLFEPSWRAGEIKNLRRALKFLENYRWSSFLDYIGKKNFPSVTQRRFLLGLVGGEKAYGADIKSWLRNFNLAEISSLSLE